MRIGLHPLPEGVAPDTSAKCNNTKATNWQRWLSARPLTLCDGHSKLVCAMHGNRKTERGYFCWARHAYQASTTSKWHLFCDPTEHWNGQHDARLLENTFSPHFNHFGTPYLRVHPLASLPTSLPQLGSSTGEVAYLLHGDSVVEPHFNPWHANADLVNFFIVQRLLALPQLGGSDGGVLAAAMSVYPVRGCNGMGPGRGNYDVWRVLTTGTVHAWRKDVAEAYRKRKEDSARAAAASIKHFRARPRDISDDSAQRAATAATARRGPYGRGRKDYAGAALNFSAAVARAYLPAVARTMRSGMMGRSLGEVAERRSRPSTRSGRYSGTSAQQAKARALSRQTGAWVDPVAAVNGNRSQRLGSRGNRTHWLPDGLRSLRPVTAVVLAPSPWRSPIWSTGEAIRKCPHRSEVLDDYRRHVGRRLDAALRPDVVALIIAAQAERADSVHVLHAAEAGGDVRALANETLRELPPTAAAPGRGRVRLVYVVRRSQGRPLQGAGTGPSGELVSSTCARCIWNVEALARGLAQMLPGAIVVLANPGELRFSLQYGAKPRTKTALSSLPRATALSSSPRATALSSFPRRRRPHRRARLCFRVGYIPHTHAGHCRGAAPWLARTQRLALRHHGRCARPTCQSPDAPSDSPSEPPSALAASDRSAHVDGTSLPAARAVRPRLPRVRRRRRPPSPSRRRARPAQPHARPRPHATTQPHRLARQERRLECHLLAPAGMAPSGLDATVREGGQPHGLLGSARQASRTRSVGQGVA